MAIEAPVSKFSKKNLRIYILLLGALAFWCVYDGYFNTSWIKEHTNPDGSQQTYLVVNRNAPPYLFGAAVLLGIYLCTISWKKIIADDNELIISPKKKIPYASIQKIDKTNFDKKGFFIITYKNNNSIEANLKLSDRKYDNLSAILDHLVAEIS